MNTAALLFTLASTLAGEADMPAWMAGCWEQRSEDFVYEEHWMAPAGDMMLGMSRTVRDGKVTATEYLRIDRTAETRTLQYTAIPSGQSLTVFTASKVESRRLVFENPAHDFPQRIIYTLGGDALTARIEGEKNGVLRGVDFTMRQVPCGS